jgi:hypothetical protein
MTKHTITRLFIGSLVAIAGGLVLLGVTGGIAYASTELSVQRASGPVR